MLFEFLVDFQFDIEFKCQRTVGSRLSQEMGRVGGKTLEALAAGYSASWLWFEGETDSMGILGNNILLEDLTICRNYHEKLDRESHYGDAEACSRGWRNYR